MAHQPGSAGAGNAPLEGQRLGPYHVTARIGAGGMGEVYKARDTRLDRTVALKVLSAHLAGDPQFRERFEREARAVAALNHPHICTLYDVGHHDASTPSTGSGQRVDYLVMEYVEGETLAARLAGGPLPIAQALQYAIQIASALDKAHRAGIVHRDIKPGNVMLTKAGAKLLDFGLAKYAATPEHGNLTSTGLILGTIHYMAPEQLEGKPIDARTDIFAFGAVLYELVTGKKIFDGTGHATIAAAILQHDPARLASLSAPALDRAVRKCLAKDPDERWQSAGDLASELEWIADGGAAADGAQRGSGFARISTRERFVWGIAALLGVALVAAVTVRPRSPRPGLTPKQLVVPLLNIESMYAGGARLVALLPDGSGLTYVGSGYGRATQLHLHTFADAVSRPLPGTERAASPFVSPDQKWIGFVQNGGLKKVATSGGPPVAICDGASANGASASWGPDDQIVFSSPGGLSRVPAAGGRPEALTTLAGGERLHTTPEILPGGKAVVFTVLSTSGALEDATIAVVSTGSTGHRPLIRAAASARYSPTGHLLYVVGSDLFAVPFDANRLTVTGTPFRVVPNVRVTPNYLLGDYDLAADGTLAYLPGGGAERQRTLVWVDRTGASRPVPVPPRPYFHLGLLPDERSVIVEIEETPHNIWHADLTSGALTRLTHEGANHRAVLSADGRAIAFSSDLTVPRSLFRHATDGSGRPERLLEAKRSHNATSWSRDGRWLAFTEVDPETKSDIWVLPLAGDRTPQPFLKTTFSEHSAAFSPDGRWIAYSSDESGRQEVMVSAFPGPGPRKQVSTNGGQSPVFSDDGATLFYRLRDQLLAAEMVTKPALRVGAPRVAFAMLPPPFDDTGLPNFAVNRKGDALLVVKDPPRELDPRNVHVIINWFDALRSAATAK